MNHFIGKAITNIGISFLSVREQSVDWNWPFFFSFFFLVLWGTGAVMHMLLANFNTKLDLAFIVALMHIHLVKNRLQLEHFYKHPLLICWLTHPLLHYRVWDLKKKALRQWTNFQASHASFGSLRGFNNWCLLFSGPHDYLSHLVHFQWPPHIKEEVSNSVSCTNSNVKDNIHSSFAPQYRSK